MDTLHRLYLAALAMASNDPSMATFDTVEEEFEEAMQEAESELVARKIYVPSFNL